MSAIHNERVKLLAQALSNTGIAVAVTGVITPVAAALYGTVPLNATLYPVTLALFLISIAFHIAAQYTLGRLNDV